MGIVNGLQIRGREGKRFCYLREGSKVAVQSSIFNDFESVNEAKY